MLSAAGWLAACGSAQACTLQQQVRNRRHLSGVCGVCRGVLKQLGQECDKLVSFFELRYPRDAVLLLGVVREEQVHHRSCVTCAGKTAGNSQRFSLVREPEVNGALLALLA